ncbi:DUF362 domain-containing protein [Candidatus Poribacteria bacterium]|nr:DUF362 domain-containing protein [Candidatus Poribacteria bacterium]
MKDIDKFPIVAIASSNDEKLGYLKAPVDAEVNYKQIDAIVRRALEVDTSDKSLKNIIKPDDWVVIKPNMVTSRSNPNCSYWYKGIPHPGQVTDLRVIKSIINYIIENCNPRRITIAEGGAEWKKNDEPGTPPEQTEDGWTVHWPEFENLSYVDMVDDFNKGYPGLVDIIDLNYDDIKFVAVPDPNNSGIGAFQRVGADRRSPEEYGREDYVPGTGTLRKGYYIPETILNCDKFISVPTMKTHLCGTTLVLKNYIGILPNHPSGVVRKHDIHHGDVQKGFVDLASYHPADYSIIQGFWSTEGNGPQWGENIRHNVVIATADPVAADAVGSAVMGFNPMDMDYIRYAARKGFGVYDLRHINVVGKTIKEVRRKFQRAVGRKGIGFCTRGNRIWMVKGGKDTEPRMFESEERYIDLTIHFCHDDTTSATAWVDINSARKQAGKLWASADGVMYIELNGQKVVEKNTSTGHIFAEYMVDIELKQGVNQLVVYTEKGEKGFGFTALICDESGDGLFDIDYSIDPSNREAVVPV